MACGYSRAGSWSGDSLGIAVTISGAWVRQLQVGSGQPGDRRRLRW
jgi:hypothetical protein